MEVYDVVLFIHILGAITLFIAFAFSQLAGAGLRGARTVEHVRLWAGAARVADRMFPLAMVVQLGSGLYLAADAWRFSTPWVVVGIAGLLVIGGAGGAVVARRFAAIGEAAGRAADGPVPAELAGRIADAGLWTSMWALNGLAAGIVWLMAVKPGWVGSIVVTVALTLAGALIGRATTRSAPIPDHPAGP